MSTANGETDAPKSNGSSSLHSAVLARDVVKVRTLINQGQPVNEQDGAGNTPLHLAAGRGLISIVQAFKEARADPNIANADGITPWQTAMFEGHARVANRLVEMGAHRSHRFVDESCQLCAVYEDQQSVATDCEGVIRRVRPTTPEGVRRLSIVVGGGLAAVWSIYIIGRAVSYGDLATDTTTVAWVWFIGAGVGYFGGIVVVRGIARIIRWTIEGFKTTPSKPSGASQQPSENLAKAKQSNNEASDSEWFKRDEGG